MSERDDWPDWLPPREVTEDVLRGPTVGPDGRIKGGTWDGMTPAEVLRQRDEFERIFGRG